MPRDPPLTLMTQEGPHIVYTEWMTGKGEGFPLYWPSPNAGLPEEQRALGVTIGDIGIISPEGAFHYLFNICNPGVDEDMEPADPGSIIVESLYYPKGEPVVSISREDVSASKPDEFLHR